MPEQSNPSPTPHEASADEKPRIAISRREFARRAALASAVASVAPAVAMTAPSVGPASTQNPPAPAPPAAAPQNPNAPRLSAESQSEADARFQAILVLYGSRFSNEQKNDLHRLCSVVQPALDRIRAYKMENGDGPALYLKPQYEREKKPKPPAAPPKPAPGQSASAKSAQPPKSAPAASAPKKP